MTIEFNCPQCTQQIRTPDATAGKRGKCPGCNAIVRIPAATEAAAPQSAPAQPPAEAAETGPIEFFCSLCGQLVRTPRAAAGKKGKCPHCQGVMQIPLKSRSAKSATPLTTPKKTTQRSPQPADEIGLAPLESLDGLAPLAETKPAPQLQPRPRAKISPAQAEDDDRELRLQSTVPLAPLTPLDSSGSSNAMTGLTPINNDLFGGTDPLASANANLASGDLFGGAPLGGDPFATSSGGFGSPASTSLAPATYSAPSSAPAGPKKPDSIFVVLPAVFQLMAIIPFFLWNGFSFASTVFLLIVAMSAPSSAANPDAAAKGIAFVILILALQVLGLAAQIWVMVGSVQMMLLRSYDNAIAAAWMSCVPCFGLCGIPFGIWSLIVLQTPEYKRMFRD